MNHDHWQKVSVTGLRDREMCSVSMEGIQVLIVRLKEKFFAYEDLCPHQRVKLSEGSLVENKLTCRGHHWCFDIETGKGINPEKTTLQAFDIEKRSDGLWINLKEKKRVYNMVGPVLRNCEQGRHLAHALCQENQEAHLIERGSYLRVEVPRICTLKMDTFRQCFGAHAAYPSALELIMHSFQGKITITDTEICWKG